MPVDPSPRFRLTRSGRALALGAVAVGAAGRVVGVEELSIVGFCLLGLVVTAWATSRLAGADLDVRRTVRPRRVEVGESFTVSVRVHNGRGGLRLPLDLVDRLDGRPVTRLVLPQRRRDPAAAADYTITATHRGLTTFGPIAVSASDPFDLARVEISIPDRVDVIVLPRIHRLGIDGALAADDPSGNLRHQRHVATVTEEFDTLRDYAPGDDVRRVHWASTARLGRPVVRTHQQPSQRRTTVVLDDRAASYPPSLGPGPFERAVSAAASVLVACLDNGDLVRLVGSAGSDTGYFDDGRRLESVLDHLAAVNTAATGNLRGALAGTVVGAGDRVVVCTGTIDAEDRAVVNGAATRSGEYVVVGTGTADPGPLAGSGRVLEVPFPDDAPLDHRWQAARLARAGRPRGVA